MFRNYMIVSFRNILKNRVFTIINIISLGIALSVCIVGFFNYMFSYEFDRTHKNFNEIYRINSVRDMQGSEQEYGLVPSTLGLEIKKDIPAIEKSARIMRTRSSVKEGEDIFSTQVSYVDPEFLEVFTFPIVLGNHKSIESQGNVLVSETMATKLFGEEYPVGKNILLFNEKNKEFIYTVSAVFKDLPENSSFSIDILSHFDNFLLMWEKNDADWKNNTTALFIKVPEKSSLSSITRSLKNYLPVQNRASEDFKINRFVLVPLKEVGKNSRKIRSPGFHPSLHPAAIITPSIMAFLILLIACFNFANTSMSAFGKRLKEIGLRKTFGGQKRQLVTQFMSETLIICFMAGVLGIVFANFLVPAYSNLWAFMSIELTLTKYAFFWVFLLLLLLLTGFIAGVYPAIYVSSLSPVNILKGIIPFKGSGRLSAILLSLQITISIITLVTGIVFTKNAYYQKTLDLGYDKDRLLVVPIAPDNFTSFRNEIITNPKIISAEGTQNHIGFGSYRAPVKDKEKLLEADGLDIGPGYAETIGLRLVAGRLFDKSMAEADRLKGSIVVNQKLAKDFEWRDPVGQTVTLFDTTRLTVIGVIEDFYMDGVWKEIEPTILRLSPTEQYSVLAVRANPEDLSGLLEYLKLKWENLSPNCVFRGISQDDIMLEEIEVNRNIVKIDFFLAVTAILLSLLGAYNLVSLEIIRRTKEMGIRKILGAPIPLIMFLAGKKFLIVLLFASLLGSMGGYYLSVTLLKSLWDYFVDIHIGILLLAASIMFVATIITIVFKIADAALKNPVISLRNE
jgi:putative ABC transport system permease protein